MPWVVFCWSISPHIVLDWFGWRYPTLRITNRDLASADLHMLVYLMCCHCQPVPSLIMQSISHAGRVSPECQSQSKMRSSHAASVAANHVTYAHWAQLPHYCMSAPHTATTGTHSGDEKDRPVNLSEESQEDIQRVKVAWGEWSTCTSDTFPLECWKTNTIEATTTTWLRKRHTTPFRSSFQ